MIEVTVNTSYGSGKRVLFVVIDVVLVVKVMGRLEVDRERNGWEINLK